MTPKLKVLVVESDIPVAMMIVSALSQVGCEVSVTTTGQKGLALAQEQKFDLVVLDKSLPDMEGFRLCCELKQRHFSRHATVIFIAEQLDDEGRQQGLDCGAVDYIIKPLDPRDFVSRVLAHVETGEIESSEQFPKVR